MYYCKNCGEEYQTDEAVLCVKCGVSKGVGTNYCHHCGKPVTPDTAVCLSCGVPCNNGAAAGAVAAPGAKSKMAAGLLAIFLGCYGIHNFYLGYTKKAVTQLVLTLVGYVLCCVIIGVIPVVGVAIWALVEGIMIFTGSINVDGNGMPLGQ